MRGKRPSPVDWAFPLTGLIIALSLTWAIGWLQSSEQNKRRQIPTAYLEAAKRDAERDCVGNDPRLVFECVEELTKTAYQVAHDEQDLTAQQRAASSALLSSIVSFLALLLSGAGVWYVKRTLEATLEAVEDTSKATKAMGDANEIAINSQRPWLALHTPPFATLGFGEVNGEARINAARLEIMVENFGQSPAIYPVPKVMAFDFTNGLDFSEAREKLFEPPLLGRGAVYPSETIDLGKRNLFPINIDQLNIPTDKMIIMVGVLYTDYRRNVTYKTSRAYLIKETFGPARNGQLKVEVIDQSLVDEII